MSELARRVVTAVILAPLAAGAIYLGGWFFAGFLIIVTIVGQSELYRMAREKGVHAFQPGGFVAGGLIVLIPMWPGTLPLAALALVMLICAELWRHHTHPIENVAVGILGVIYPSFFVAWYLYIRVEAVGSLGEMNAFLITLAIMVSVWAADIFAYFIGKNFGKTQLIPRISPKKRLKGLSVG